MMTSSTRSTPTPERSIAFLIAMAPSFGAGTSARVPPNFPIAVRAAPTIGVPRFKGGAIALEGASNLVVPGAALFVDGVDRFRLERLPNGQVRTVKSATGTASGLRLGKAVRAGRQVTLVVVNPDGGRSAEVTFRR